LGLRRDRVPKTRWNQYKEISVNSPVQVGRKQSSSIMRVFEVGHAVKKLSLYPESSVRLVLMVFKFGVVPSTN